MKLLLPTILSFLSVECLADWEPPYDRYPNTVGAKLERHFSDLLSTCGIPVPLRKEGFFSSQYLSSIPWSLQVNNVLPLKSNLFFETENSPARLFAYLYTDRERLAAIDLKNTRLLPVDYAQDAAEFTLKGGVDSLYRQSCSSIIGAAASFQSQWTLPIASLSTALASEFGTDRKTEFYLAYGNLRSPLDTRYRSPSPYQQLFAALTFWQWYASSNSDAADASGGKYYYLSHLSPVALYEYTGDKQKLSGSLDAKGSIGISPVSAAGRVTTSFSSSASLTNEHNYTLILAPADGRSWGEFQPAPTISEIMQLATRATAQGTSPNGVISGGSQIVHSQFVPGIPAALCDKSAWTAEYRSAADNALGVLVVSDAIKSVDDNISPPLEACEFKVGFTLAPNHAREPVNVGLKFDLRYNVQAMGNRLSIPAGQIDLATAASVSIKRQSDDRNFIIENSDAQAGGQADKRVRWSVKYLVRDNPDDKIRAESPSVDSLALRCPGGLNPFVVANSSYDVTSRVLTIFIESTIHGDEGRDIGGTTPALKCSVIGTADFIMATPTNGSRVQKRPLGDDSIYFYYPAVKPAPIPAPTSAPTSAPTPAPVAASVVVPTVGPAVAPTSVAQSDSAPVQ